MKKSMWPCVISKGIKTFGWVNLGKCYQLLAYAIPGEERPDLKSLMMGREGGESLQLQNVNFKPPIFSSVQTVYLNGKQR